ncbi:MAG TPA: type 4a pilus biogenesis protein PilO [Candidatus Saccharicenans sp.]|jgi:Tfp pilus assembly protein PilO|nr:type 4a pilus biogenesis protein PilO [Candidatus Saccharicenans sp.]HOE14116.1 type 4a pilus biogenesis protein PilO [Candidatus Saccharicenans sp.]HOP59949.1 type 4a pilus biogenesis protein PilO [Candidatus Saccharicenans sp.]HQM74790.1 type 4a pilus biogenesis protein PilO [Candidatus Saccharicenans sp.]
MRNWPWYGYLLLAVIIFALVFFFFFKPRNAEIQNLRESRMKLEKEVEVLKEQKKELDKIEAELVVLNATLKDLEQIIPQKKEIADILRRIQQLAYDSRLNVLRFQPRGEVRKDFYAEWPINIEISGTYHNLGIFFDKLSKFSRLFNVNNFSITALNNQTDELTIGAKFVATTYYFVEEQPAAAKTAATKAQR